MSEGNSVIAECLLAFDPAGPASFATFLYRAMSRRMPSVARHEWVGTMERTYADAGPDRQHRKVTSTTYQGPHFCDLPHDPATYDDNAWIPPVPPALTVPAPQEALCLLREALGFVAQHVNATEQVYLWHSVDGEDAAEIGQRYRVHKRVMQRRLQVVRERLHTWREEVSYAAADQESRSCRPGKGSLGVAL